MKRYLVFLAFVMVLPLAALRPGDRVAEPASRVKWLNCTPFKLGPLSGEEKNLLPPYRALVFMFTRSDSSDRLIRILEHTRLANRGKLLVAVVTPDAEYDAKLFMKRHPDVRVRMIIDSERKVTPLFMAGSMLYPMAFLYDADGKILWSGEAVDLPEMMESAVNGRIDAARQRKIALLLDEMQQRMRTGEERPLRQTAEKIFSLDPANPSALRMRLFSLENQGNISGAWELVNARIKAAPGKLRLYYTAIDLMRRHRELQKMLPQLTEQFVKSASTPGELIAFGEALLMNFPENASAVESVVKIISDKAPFSDLPPLEKAQYHLLCARVRYILGNLDAAVTNMQRALDIYRSRRHRAGINAASAQLEFYRKLKTLDSVNF